MLAELDSTASGCDENLLFFLFCRVQLRMGRSGVLAHQDAVLLVDWVNHLRVW